MQHQENNFINDSLQLLNFCSTWILVRQQWLVDNMRSILTGENTPSRDNIVEFDDANITNLNLSKNLLKNFYATQTLLEQSWLKAVKASHPMSGLTLLSN